MKSYDFLAIVSIIVVEFLTSCKVTQIGEPVQFQNYYRKDIETPVQPTTSSNTYISPHFKKGDVELKGTYTKSGKNYDNPKTSYNDEEGKARFEKIEIYSHNLQYAIDDKWLVSSQYAMGSDVHITSVQRFTVTNYEAEILGTGAIGDALAYVLTNGGISSNFSNISFESSSVVSTPIIDVKHAYNYWFTTFGASRKMGKFSSKNAGFSLAGGLGIGAAQLTGTIHAKDDAIYKTIKNATNDATKNAAPITYGDHKNKHVQLFFQPNLSYLIGGVLELGISNRVSYYINNTRSRLLIEGATGNIDFKNKYQIILMQPTMGVFLGKKHIKGGIEVAAVKYISNPTKEKFNSPLCTFSLAIMVPTKK